MVGASWGGMVVNLFARSNPTKVSGLVFVDGASDCFKDALTSDQWTGWMQLIDTSTAPGRDAPDYESSVDEIRAASPFPAVTAVVLTVDKPWNMPLGDTGPTWSAPFATRGRKPRARPQSARDIDAQGHEPSAAPLRTDLPLGRPESGTSLHCEVWSVNIAWVEVRAAKPGDVQAATVTLADAFGADPVWSWAFPQHDQLQVWWRFWIAGAVPQGWVRMTESAESVSVWIPPGGTECAPEDEPHIEPLLQALIGTRAGVVLETLERFEHHHPRETPHYYLSLLGTASSHRGKGLGMALLAENLARIDEQRGAAYLESSNPANLGRYETVGFVPVGEFRLPQGDVVVTTMWRDPVATAKGR